LVLPFPFRIPFPTWVGFESSVFCCWKNLMKNIKYQQPLFPIIPYPFIVFGANNNGLN